jgi:hypothetical protein
VQGFKGWRVMAWRLSGCAGDDLHHEGKLRWSMPGRGSWKADRAIGQSK